MSTVLSGARARPRSGLLLRGLSDEKLVARVRSGDERAFEVVYDRYQGPLLSFARHMLGDHAEAEDVLQHTFVAAHRALLTDDRPIQLKAWLFAIARNRCLTVLRSRRHDCELDDAAPSVRGLSAEVEQRADLRDLLADLRRLPEEQRAALVLFELGAHTHEDIAVILDVRKEKVKALVFQARETLQAQRSARETDCTTIREELATLRGGALRRSHLRRHLDDCPGCTQFRAEVARQRAAMSALLPVIPGVTLKSAVLGGLFGGGGAGGLGSSLGGGGAAAAGAGAAGLGATASGGGMLSLLGVQGAAVKGLSVIAATAGAGGGVFAIDRLTDEPRPPVRAAESAPSGPASAVPAPPSVTAATDLRSFAPATSRFAGRPQHVGRPGPVRATVVVRRTVGAPVVVPTAAGAFGPLAPGLIVPASTPGDPAAVTVPAARPPAIVGPAAGSDRPAQNASVDRRNDGRGRVRERGRERASGVAAVNVAASSDAVPRPRPGSGSGAPARARPVSVRRPPSRTAAPGRARPAAPAPARASSASVKARPSSVPAPRAKARPSSVPAPRAKARPSSVPAPRAKAPSRPATAQRAPKATPTPKREGRGGSAPAPATTPATAPAPPQGGDNGKHADPPGRSGAGGQGPDKR